MQKREKIGIVIAVILIIFFIITTWNRQSAINNRAKIDCETACYEVGSAGWTFPGAGPVSKVAYPTKEGCVSVCQAKTEK